MDSPFVTLSSSVSIERGFSAVEISSVDYLPFFGAISRSKWEKIHAQCFNGRKSSLGYSSTISASQTFNVSTSGQQNFAVPGSLPGTVPP